MDSPATAGVSLNSVEEPHIAVFSKFAANSKTMALDNEPVGPERRDKPLDRPG
jgi:hypothetical protein